MGPSHSALPLWRSQGLCHSSCCSDELVPKTSAPDPELVGLWSRPPSCGWCTRWSSRLCGVSSAWSTWWGTPQPQASGATTDGHVSAPTTSEPLRWRIPTRAASRSPGVSPCRQVHWSVWGRTSNRFWYWMDCSHKSAHSEYSWNVDASPSHTGTPSFVLSTLFVSLDPFFPSSGLSRPEASRSLDSFLASQRKAGSATVQADQSPRHEELMAANDLAGGAKGTSDCNHLFVSWALKCCRKRPASVPVRMAQLQYIYIYIMSNLALESTLDSASVRLKIYCFLLDLDLLKEAPKNIRYRFPNT